MTLIDSHAHLTSEAIFPSIEEILARAQTVGLTSIINICTDGLTLTRGLKLSQEYPWIYNTGATTPHDVEKEGEELFPVFEACARQGKFVAIGETGLDYYYAHSPKELQQHFLRRYLKLALECHLPVVIHCREAFADLFTILDNDYVVQGKHAPGVLHCFTGTEEEAQEVVKRGWFLSLSGIVTFKKSDTLRAVAKLVPLNQLLIETDSPYLAPQSQRGKMNEPAFIQETAQLIAEIKGISLDDLKIATTKNASRCFNLKQKSE